MELIFPAAARNAGNREINALTEELLNKKGGLLKISVDKVQVNIVR